MIYFAPIQGFTNFIYRNVYAQHFKGIDKYFAPYIQLKNKKILPKYQEDVALKNNANIAIVPQILATNINEYEILINFLIDNGYNEINLNMGCPYPMVTNRNKGAGLLNQPQKIDELLNFHFSNYSSQLSIKLRSGLNNSNEILNIIDILNQYPIKETIYHPRTAKQLYKGNIDYLNFDIISKKINHPLVYNGDINTVDDYRMITQKFKSTHAIMIGRGILTNPLLPEEISGQKIDNHLYAMKIFHDDLLSTYIEKMDNHGNALNKMKQYWSYWGSHFSNKKKSLKQIKKCKTIKDYQFAIEEIFTSI